jgi:hypothetical protein
MRLSVMLWLSRAPHLEGPQHHVDLHSLLLCPGCGCVAATAGRQHAVQRGRGCAFAQRTHASIWPHAPTALQAAPRRRHGRKVVAAALWNTRHVVVHPLKQAWDHDCCHGCLCVCWFVAAACSRRRLRPLHARNIVSTWVGRPVLRRVANQAPTKEGQRLSKTPASLGFQRMAR